MYLKLSLKPFRVNTRKVYVGLTGSGEDRDSSKLETLVWDPSNPLGDKQADQFLVISR